MPEPVNNEKKCPACGEVLPVSDFWKNRAQSDGLDTACKECTTERRKSQNYRAARSKNPNLVKSSIEWYMHGLTGRDY